jgi:nitroreductase
MDLLEIIKNRRSMRSYKKRDLPQDIIEKLLEAARWAPSGGNVQSWAFVVARSLKVKQGLSNRGFWAKRP